LTVEQRTNNEQQTATNENSYFLFLCFNHHSPITTIYPSSIIHHRLPVTLSNQVTSIGVRYNLSHYYINSTMESSCALITPFSTATPISIPMVPTIAATSDTTSATAADLLVVFESSESPPVAFTTATADTDPTDIACLKAALLKIPSSSPSSAFAASMLQSLKQIQSKHDIIGADPQPVKRKRWKKPAIKKRRRFGLNIPVNVGYYPSSDDDDDDDDDDNDEQEHDHDDEGDDHGDDDYDANCESQSDSHHDHSVSASLPTRRTRKQRSIFQPEDTRDVPPTKKSKKKRGRPTLISRKNHDINSDSVSVSVSTINKTNDASSFTALAPSWHHGTRGAGTLGKAEPLKNKKKKITASSSKANKAKKKIKGKAKIKVKSFDQRLQDLQSFQAEYGHCNVPYTYAPNQPLSNWVSNVRYSFGLVEKGRTPTIKITEERTASLQKLGFAFKFGGGKKEKKK
jgi:hypothetical protein